MNHRGLRVAVRSVEKIAGRRRLAQLARLVTREVRLDSGNDIESNGETTVQRVALSASAPVVFDVGAHYGEWSRSLLAQPGNRPTLHAFEPSGHSYVIATEALGDRAEVHPLALSDAPGEASLRIVHEGAGSNSLVPFSEVGIGIATETVQLSTVDDEAQAAHIDRITLLKVDAEGHDLAVLRGAAGLLRAQAIDLVQFEYNRRWIDSRTFLADAFELLTPLGYRIGKITSRGIEVYPRWHHELETFNEGNYLAYLPEWEGRFPTLRWWGG